LVLLDFLTELLCELLWCSGLAVDGVVVVVVVVVVAASATAAAMARITIRRSRSILDFSAIGR